MKRKICLAEIILMISILSCVPVYAEGVSLTGDGLTLERYDENSYEEFSYSADEAEVEYIVKVEFEEEGEKEVILTTTVGEATDYTVMVFDGDSVFEQPEVTYDTEAGTLTFSAESGDIIAIAMQEGIGLSYIEEADDYGKMPSPGIFIAFTLIATVATLAIKGLQHRKDYISEDEYRRLREEVSDLKKEKEAETATRETQKAERTKIETKPLTLSEYSTELLNRYHKIRTNKYTYDDVLLKEIAKLKTELDNLVNYEKKYPEIDTDRTYLKLLKYYLPELLNSIDAVIEANFLEERSDAVELRKEVVNMISDMQTSIHNFISNDVLSSKVMEAGSSAKAARLMMQQDGLLDSDFDKIKEKRGMLV